MSHELTHRVAIQDVSVTLDKIAIFLSGFCTVHCLALPFILPLLPGLLLQHSSDETVHLLILFIALPVSAVGLVMGYRQHGHLRPCVLASTGLTIMMSAIYIEYPYFDGHHEKILTLAGATLVSIAHIINCKYRRHLNCRC